MCKAKGPVVIRDIAPCPIGYSAGTWFITSWYSKIILYGAIKPVGSEINLLVHNIDDLVQCSFSVFTITNSELYKCW